MFLPKGKSLQSYRAQVYDTWGNMLWESTAINPADGSPAEGWDCTYQGELVPQGVYVWSIDAIFIDGSIWLGEPDETAGNKPKTVGTVTVIR